MSEEKISVDQLMDQHVLQEVDELIRESQDDLKISIGEVGKLSGASHTQLRYWEDLGLIQSKREAESLRSSREYTLRDLRRAIWLRRFISHNGWTPRKVQQAFETGSFVDPLLSAVLAPTWYGPAVSLSIEEHIDQASQFPLFHFIAPRIAKAALALICGELRPHTGFAMSLGHTGATSCEELEGLNEKLVPLGKSLLCFHGDRGLTSLMVKEALYSVRGNWDFAEVFFERVGRVVVIGVKDEELGESILEKDHRYQALEQMLAFLLTLVHKQERIGHLSSVYAVHSGSGRSTEIRLDDLANTAVALGEGRWSFCSILSPSYNDYIWDKARLRVVGVSTHCPHGRDVILNYREGISSRAYRDGQTVYVPNTAQESHLIARYAAEKNVQSAIAVPIAHAGRCIGVLYLTSEQKDDFNKSDEIMLSLLALAVGQVLRVGSTSMDFDDMIGYAAAHPRVCDPRFADFKTRVDFREAMIEEINKACEGAMDQKLWLLAVDINNSRRIQLKDGAREEWAIRRCWQYVGKKMLQMLRQSSAASGLREEGCQLYRTKVDQYVAILRETPDQWAHAFGVMLQKALSNPPPDLSNGSDEDSIDEVTVRVAVWQGSPGFLKDIALAGKVHAVETLARLLEETLEHARHSGLISYREEDREPKGIKS